MLAFLMTKKEREKNRCELYITYLGWSYLNHISQQLPGEQSFDIKIWE